LSKRKKVEEMARLNRLSYREEVTSKITYRMKQLILVVLTALFGVLISVSVNAQTLSKKSTSKKGTYQSYKKRNRAKANHYAGVQQQRDSKFTEAETSTKNVGEGLVHNSTKSDNNISLEAATLPAPTTFNHSLIREMVALNLKEQAEAAPIELAPLLFKVSGNRLSVKDVNPFLIALEFGLQGKVIVIDNHPITGDDYNSENKSFLVDQIIVRMIELGVPAARIAVDATTSAEQQLPETEFFSVSFTAL
jgi:hypothetical protein